MITREELDIHTFSWDGLGLIDVWKQNCSIKEGSIPYKLRKNGEAWIHFVAGICNRYCPDHPHGMKWSASFLYMNQMNCNFVHTQVSGWLWLDVSPIRANILEDDEYGVKVNEILTECP